MKVTARAHMIGIALYSLPFLAVVVVSLFFVWAGTVEMIITGIALLPALLYLFGIRWCRYVVGVFSAINFLACSIIPFVRGTEGKYFWLIWSLIWFSFAFPSLISFIPLRQPPHDAC